MVSMQTLKLLDALIPLGSEGQKDRLLALYREAFCGTESFQNLKELLEDCEFHGAAGRELLAKGEDVLRSGFTDAGNFGDRITVMDYVVQQMVQELEASEKYLHSASVSGTALNVLDKRLAETATQYYEQLFHYTCCLYVTLYGESALQNVNIRTGIRSADLVRNVTDELCLLLEDVRRLPKPRAWRIVRTRFTGANLVHYRGFALEYGSVTPAYLDSNCQKLGPCLFRDKNDPDVLCCGIGHLTSLTPQDGGRLYGARVISKPALNCLKDLQLDYDSLDIPALLGAIAGTGVCVLKPEELVELLNRYFLIRSAEENRRSGCPYCGRSGCQHFRIPNDFSK